MAVLGDGAYGDPERPWLTRAEFDAEGEADVVDAHDVEPPALTDEDEDDDA